MPNDENMASWPLDTPNPGSDAALARGCLCAVLDNNHGRYAPYGMNGWWITEGCPVHAPGETKEA